ncbi:MAG: hypothetical protein RL032_310, partial [Pseudomonadota bacterium]
MLMSQNVEAVKEVRPRSPQRALMGTGLVLATVVVLCGAFLAVYGWNWLRGPVERYTLQKTGRELVIAGDITVHWGWPALRVQAAAVTFANPPWAQEKQMVTAQGVEVSVNLPQLLQRTVAFPEVRLEQATIFLEQASGGRKSWLLDLAQQDENARIAIGRIALTNGTLGYDHKDYEQYIFDTGRVPTRDGLHDFFNGLCWLPSPTPEPAGWPPSLRLGPYRKQCLHRHSEKWRGTAMACCPSWAPCSCFPR